MSYFYSLNNEDYNEDSFDCAVDEAFIQAVENEETKWEIGNFVYIYRGTLEKVSISEITSHGDNVLEQVSECSDEYGGDEYLWYGVERDQVKELDEAIGKVLELWADKYKHQPTFGLIKNVEKLKVALVEKKRNEAGEHGVYKTEVVEND